MTKPLPQEPIGFSDPILKASEAIEPRPRETHIMPRGPDVAGMMERAIGMGPEGVAALRELVTLHREQQEYNARLEFFEALARFQDECPPVPKSAVAGFKTRSGGEVAYRYADLEGILTHTRDLLRKHGFSLTFDSESTGAQLKCIGVLRHVNGHSERSSFTVPTSSANPGMSDQQKASGALTFAKRAVTISLLGLIVTEPDPEAEADATVLTQDQVANISALLDETKTDRAAFLKWANASDLEDMRASRYEDAVRYLERKRGGR